MKYPVKVNEIYSKEGFINLMNQIQNNYLKEKNEIESSSSMVPPSLFSEYHSVIVDTLNSVAGVTSMRAIKKLVPYLGNPKNKNGELTFSSERILSALENGQMEKILDVWEKNDPDFNENLSLAYSITLKGKDKEETKVNNFDEASRMKAKENDAKRAAAVNRRNHKTASKISNPRFAKMEKEEKMEALKKERISNMHRDAKTTERKINRKYGYADETKASPEIREKISLAKADFANKSFDEVKTSYQNVSSSLEEIKFNDEAYKLCMLDIYSKLCQAHDDRSFVSKFFHPFRNHAENQMISSLKDRMLGEGIAIEEIEASKTGFSGLDEFIENLGKDFLSEEDEKTRVEIDLGEKDKDVLKDILEEDKDLSLGLNLNSPGLLNK